MFNAKGAESAERSFMKSFETELIHRWRRGERKEKRDGIGKGKRERQNGEWKMGGAKSPFRPLQKGEQNTVGPSTGSGRTVRSVSAEKQPNELGNYRDSD